MKTLRIVYSITSENHWFITIRSYEGKRFPSLMHDNEYYGKDGYCACPGSSHKYFTELNKIRNFSKTYPNVKFTIVKFYLKRIKGKTVKRTSYYNSNGDIIVRYMINGKFIYSKSKKDKW